MIEWGNMNSDPVLEACMQGIRPLRADIRDIYLFGSRARGSEKPDSDYDLLIVAKKKDYILKDRIYDALTDVSIKYRRDISLKFFPASEFDRLKAIPSHFIQNVLKDGIRLG